ncbi:MAG: SDR family oxidoreductase [Saprospirales bacterium]|nr:MAG: SDR family oxidoreductase [Saprospirales bacterium]
MKILITGGAGYIGYQLVRQINKLDIANEIRVYDNLSRAGLPFFTGAEKVKNLQFIRADILDTHALKNAINDIDTVVHLAAFVSQPYNHLQNLQYEQINRWGSLNLARLAREIDTIKKAIYLSSSAVYGFREDIHAGDEPTPNNAYGESKYQGEMYFSLLKDHCSSHIIRAGNVFGYNPCMRMDSVLNSWVFRAIVEGKFVIYGSGEQTRAFVPVEEVTKKLIDAIVGERTSDIETSISFCASLNQIKDWLTGSLPETEFKYLNRNQIFPSQNFPGHPLEEEHYKLLYNHLERMKKELVL